MSSYSAYGPHAAKATYLAHFDTIHVTFPATHLPLLTFDNYSDDRCNLTHGAATFTDRRNAVSSMSKVGAGT